MKKASLFKNGKNQAVRLPREVEFKGINEVEVRKEGRSVILTPVKKSWLSFAEEAQADADFLQNRDQIFNEGRFEN